jgi:hypothetical protein
MEWNFFQIFFAAGSNRLSHPFIDYIICIGTKTSNRGRITSPPRQKLFPVDTLLGFIATILHPKQDLSGYERLLLA